MLFWMVDTIDMISQKVKLVCFPWTACIFLRKIIANLKEEICKKADLEDFEKINQSVIENEVKIKELENYAKFIS